MTVSLQPAGMAHLDVLLAMIRAYHEFEGLQVSDNQRETALRCLLEPEQAVGRLWLIQHDSEPVGYIALSFGFSIEYGGRDAFLDEFFIQESLRGRGIGRRSLALVQQQARELGLCALHLIVARTNTPSLRLYTAAGFAARDRFQLMSCPLSSDQTPVRLLNGEA